MQNYFKQSSVAGSRRLNSNYLQILQISEQGTDFLPDLHDLPNLPSSHLQFCELE
jgi:hypothetical protein